MQKLALLTDLYQLTMLGGYFDHSKLQQKACFELYFRRLPFESGFCIAAGLDLVLEYLENLRFEAEDVAYLRSLKLFKEPFLDWLLDFKFSGDVWGLPEGSVVFAHQPLLRIEANLPEAQLVESTLLNLVNFQTLVATKATRIKLAAGSDTVFEFGMRRAQGIDGAMSASRAAFIGGSDATSNVLAGHQYQIPVQGTHAHSWIMSFESELEAFRAYAQTYPQACTLLVDTYDTLLSGVPNAVIVGQEMQQRGQNLGAIRLDSGDMATLSVAARSLLDAAGLTRTKIVASNDLDEHSIVDLKSKGAAIDIWGVGTNLVTCKDDPALGGVYKLVATADSHGVMRPRIKLSATPGKSTVPGVKQIQRATDADGILQADILTLTTEAFPEGPASLEFFDWIHNQESTVVYDRLTPLLVPVIKQGRRLVEREGLDQKRHRTLQSLETLPPGLKALKSGTDYPVGLSRSLRDLRSSLLISSDR